MKNTSVILSGCALLYLVVFQTGFYDPFRRNYSSLGVYKFSTGVYSRKFQNDYTLLSKLDESEVSFWDECELPKYDVWDDELLPYLNPDNNPLKNCDQKFKPLTELKNSSWSVRDPKSKFVCRARCHTRKSERENIISNWTFQPGPVDCEILETVCADNKKDVYGYLHTQIIPKPKENLPKTNTTDLKQFDVFVILLDSLSFSQAQRFFPRTISYFTNHMKGVLFPYMNKVGENSRPNGIPIWFGKSLERIDKTLFDEGITPPDWTHSYFCRNFKDNETSLFSEFQYYGYRTFLAEDWAEGTMNWPNCVGFDKPPIDHNMRPFQNAYERKNQGEEITQKHLKGHLCREYHHTLLDYMGQFMDAYPDQKKFGWMWASVLGHDSENGFAHADKDFHKYLMDHGKQLENSFVFFLGDHGLRFGNVRKTFVGALDVNNPMTAVSIPNSLRNTTSILEILKENAKKVQSHYDTRATMLDIMKYQSAKNFTETEPHQIPGEKGHSYIRKQPGVTRNCRNLPVPLEYCICQFNKTSVSNVTDTAWIIGLAIAENVNWQISEGNFTNKCIRMKFGKTLQLLQYQHKFKGATLYEVSVKMQEPSNAEFKGKVKILDDKVQVLGLVERINQYGKTADCINSQYHRPFCYCKNQENDGKKATKKKPN